MSKHETCPTCNRMTEAGKKTWREACKPIYGVDLSKPLSETIELIRGQISTIRGKLHDIGFAKTAWTQDMESVQGLLTCGLVTLHWIMEEMKKAEKTKEELSKKQTEI